MGLQSSNLQSSNIDKIVETFNTSLLETASEILGKRRKVNKPWITREVLDLCDRRRELKPLRKLDTHKAEYREINKEVKRKLKEAKENWIDDQCAVVDDCIIRNNTKQAYDIVKKLTDSEQGKGKATIIKSKQGVELTEEKDVLGRWTEYCSDLYGSEGSGDPTVLHHPIPEEEAPLPILREEVAAAVRTLKLGKAPGVDNITAELLKAGGEPVITVLTKVCNEVMKTGIWPTEWTKSLVIALPKKGASKLCENHRTISLISHASKVMLRILLDRLKPQVNEKLSEEQAGFRAGRSTTEQIFNINILTQKYCQHKQDLYQVFIDYKKAFDRVWHGALWATMHIAQVQHQCKHSEDSDEPLQLCNQCRSVQWQGWAMVQDKDWSKTGLLTISHTLQPVPGDDNDRGPGEARRNSEHRGKECNRPTLCRRY